MLSSKASFEENRERLMSDSDHDWQLKERAFIFEFKQIGRSASII